MASQEVESKGKGRTFIIVIFTVLSSPESVGLGLWVWGAVSP